MKRAPRAKEALDETRRIADAIRAQIVATEQRTGIVLVGRTHLGAIAASSVDAGDRLVG